MKGYKAMLFDLDDTLLDRNKAVEKMFLTIVEKCYKEVDHITESEMLKRFKGYDLRSYGQGDKTIVLESFFDEYPPINRLPRDYMQEFWNNHFPHCFSYTTRSYSSRSILCST